ncbi:hypothetical protein DI464_15975 [Salmonella enterica subsp. enterica serovar Urbana]|nr:hypothetical protein [Salmonella enterica]EDU3036414.1 hypothetical protein [Salmonella enterica subsp. enterica serovar Neudorf]EHF5602519.1 hypothetical protein [Salmonella enterica subsp. enterica serovar Muenchen]EDR0213941.1 hypothetical protein [Salmonella enterica subsp. enterica serovar Urbana]EDR3939725.1 hypothetical protein [Salmonella enterica]EDU5371663.1 hypothetical protein [Salmonella enterica subsp. enterica serovar Urbana]
MKKTRYTEEKMRQADHQSSDLLQLINPVAIANEKRSGCNGKVLSVLT